MFLSDPDTKAEQLKKKKIIDGYNDQIQYFFLIFAPLKAIKKLKKTEYEREMDWAYCVYRL